MRRRCSNEPGLTAPSAQKTSTLRNSAPWRDPIGHFVPAEGRGMGQLYDSIGTHYARYRRPDPRIAAAITNALGDARRIVNVGAGTGSYEPTDRELIAVEPSEMMIRQRVPAAAPVVRATAMNLPFRDGAFDAALAILTIHH